MQWPAPTLSWFHMFSVPFNFNFINISSSKIPSIEFNWDLSNAVILMLNHNNLTSVYLLRSFCDFKHIHLLNLNFNQIRTISKENRSTTLNSTQELLLSFKSLNHLFPLAFTDFFLVSLLDLSYNHLSILHFNTFAGSFALKVLKLQSNNLFAVNQDLNNQLNLQLIITDHFQTYMALSMW